MQVQAGFASVRNPDSVRNIVRPSSTMDFSHRAGGFADGLANGLVHLTSFILIEMGPLIAAICVLRLGHNGPKLRPG